MSEGGVLLTESEKIVINALECYMNNCKTQLKPDYKLLASSIKLAKMHKVDTIFFCIYKDSLQKNFSRENYLILKNDILIKTSMQTIKNVELMKICRLFEDSGIKYLIYKGIVCREMYQIPEIRISSDEDFLIDETDMDNAIKLMGDCGYSVLIQKANEVKLVNWSKSMIVELHKRVVDINDGEWEKINNIFINELNLQNYINIDGEKIHTFSVDCNFLILIIHLFNHFIKGGVGIRQVMDIAKYYELNNEKIDFAFIRDVLNRICAYQFYEAVIYICKKYFLLDYSGTENAVAEELLDDMMAAGAFGTSFKYREHSGAMTKRIVIGKSSTFSSVVDSLYPSNRQMIEKYPELSENPEKIRAHRLKRLVSFVREKDKLKSFSTGKKRKTLMKKLGII